ncbi:MAG: CSLREA domain-containing protein, partial [Bdellovibrionales bacterium]|nr:CSLREA domain-containing protein [Bdellovibrionales bacterium]
MLRLHLRACILSLIFLSNTALSATFTVNTIADGPDANPGNGICATAGGVCSLRAAIMEANTTAAADTISLPKGTYLLTEVGASEDSGLTGDLDIFYPLTINGAKTTETIIDGLGLDRIFHVRLVGSLTLTNATLTNGFLSDPGGAIYSETMNELSVSKVNCIGNFGDAGGALFSNGPLTVSYSLFENNSASTGGALFRSGPGSVSITHSTFRNNAAASIGAVFVTTDSTTTISDCVFEGNTASSIASIYLTNSSANNSEITNTAFLDNASPSIGAFYYSGNGPISFTDCSFTNNHSDSDIGGGMYITAPELSITRSTFSNNFGNAGAADVFFNSTGGNFSFIDSTSMNPECGSGTGCSLYVAGTGP